MVRRPLRWTTATLPLLLLFNVGVQAQNDYRGKPLGKLSQLHHGVSGEVFAVDARTLHIRNFNYDGEGPAAYFYVGSSKAPGVNGFRIRDERGTTNVLPRYRNADITLTLPEGKSLQNIRWFSVWCDEFAVNFGDVKIPKGFEFPRPFKLGSLSGIHGVSSDPVVIVDAQTLLIPNFSYDGEAPDAKFWVGQGTRPTPQGIRIPDENGKTDPLRRYDRKTIVLTLPGEMTVFDIGHFGVWCEAFTVDFGHVLIPQGLNVPPSLKMLGVSPQSKLNCEVLWDDLAYEVRWAVAGDSIVLQLVARLEGGEYMAFGISGHDTKSQMVGGDVTVAWVDKDTLKGQAKDYYLDAKSQCSGSRGSCPDERLSEKSNSVRLLNAALVNGYSIVTFQRSLKAQDEYDRPIFTNGTQPVIWAIGPLNQRQEVSYHSIANRADILLDFGRPPKWNCPTPESQNIPNPPSASTPIRQQPQVPEIKQQNPVRLEQPHRLKPNTATPAPAPKVKPWDIPPIQCNEPEDGVFYAQMGPTGGKRGYPAITGHVGWGISWYINGLLIPEINVVRGRTYTFIVEGGQDPQTPARYHPFYITDDPVGGYEYKTPEERAKVQIFAGAVQNKKGEVRPTGVGRLCNWTPDQNQPQADEFASFGAYQRTLRLECDQGEPGIVQWTVEEDTPDTVYYQCYTHRYLGWKINVLDECEVGAGSDPEPVFVKAPEDSAAEPTIQHVSKIKPDSPNNLDYPKNSQLTYVPVPHFKFYNEETGQPLDDETIRKINIDVSKLQSQFYEALPSPTPLVAGFPPPLNSDEQFLNFFHTPKPSFVKQEPTPKPLRQYSVEESQEEEQPRPVQPFKLTPQESKQKNHHQEGLSNFQNEKPSLPPFPFESPVVDEKFRQEFLKNYQQLQAEAAKLKKQTSKPNRVQFSAPRRPSHHPFTLQQRPLPPGAFRPPFLPPPNKTPAKRPYPSASQKIPSYSKFPPNQKFARQPTKPPQINMKQVLALQKLLSTITPRDPPQPTTPSYKEVPTSSPFSVNTGFNPSSVKVEGGFKPILNTGVSPSFRAAEDRMDLVDEDTAGDNTGVIDLTKVAEEKTEDQEISNTTEDIFKHLKPVKFEPMFVPSPPDYRHQKTSPKKKPVGKYRGSIKNRNNYLQPYNGEKNKYVKMRPRPTLIRRPLYPDNIVPPFKIPVRGGVPHFRYHEDDSVENTTNFDSIEISEEESNSTEIDELENASQNATDSEDELAMADERREVYILPSSSLTYDGQQVPGVAPPPPETLRTFDIRQQPQSVPFRGELPSFPASFDDLPQLKESNAARGDILPPGHRGKRSPDHVPGHVGDDHDQYDHDHHDHDHHHEEKAAGSGSRVAAVFLLNLVTLLWFL